MVSFGYCVFAGWILITIIETVKYYRIDKKKLAERKKDMELFWAEESRLGQTLIAAEQSADPEKYRADLEIYSELSPKHAEILKERIEVVMAKNSQRTPAP